MNRRIHLVQDWWYERTACNCCEGIYDEVWVVYESGKELSTHYSQESAKAWVLDRLVESGEIDYSEELSDYPE